MASAQTIVLDLLQTVQHKIHLTDHKNHSHSLGQGQGPMQSQISIHHPDFYSRLLRQGSLGLGESYMEGWWSADDQELTAFLGILLTSPLYFEVMGNFKHMSRIFLHRLATSPQSLLKRQRNIAHHYDLSNAFYKYMLDPTMGYTCGYRKTLEDTDEQLQTNKYEKVCAKLALKPGQSLIDIGCGWGGFLIYAAQTRGIHGRGVTLSREQADLANKRIQELGLTDKIRVDYCDYQHVTDRYDRLSAIGVLEHVGLKDYKTFMTRSKELLTPEGCGLFHFISTTDHEKVKPEPWIQKYIFPGGRLPRLHEIVQEMLHAELTIAHVENLKLHYAETLKGWHQNFVHHWPEIQKLDPKFNEAFFRQWVYYLKSCEASFRYDVLQLYQILFSKGTHWPFGYEVVPVAESH